MGWGKGHFAQNWPWGVNKFVSGTSQGSTHAALQGTCAALWITQCCLTRYQVQIFWPPPGQFYGYFGYFVPYDLYPTPFLSKIWSLKKSKNNDMILPKIRVLYPHFTHLEMICVLRQSVLTIHLRHHLNVHHWMGSSAIGKAGMIGPCKNNW